MLVFLKIFVAQAVNPDDAGHNDESHRRENHEPVVDIAMIVAPLWHYLIAQQRAASEQFTEKGHDHEDDCITAAVADAVEKRRPGFAIANASSRPMRIQLVMISPINTESCLLTS